MRNFDYIKDIKEIAALYRFCSAAEQLQVSAPDMSAINARRALEYVVKAIYIMKDIEVSERASLLELMNGEPFADFIADERVMMAAHYVRKAGNNGAHSGKVSRKESFFALLNIYNVVGAVLLKLKVVDEVRPFDKSLIPNKPQETTMVSVPVEVKPTDAIVVQADKTALASTEPVAEIKSDISEAETRRMYIDMMLREAGWVVLATEGALEPLKACIEVELRGMPNMQCVGYADYVLFGSNGVPLAVIEAKRTSVSPAVGRHQAELYADCIEQRYGVRPVIYYTNGFETYIIDGLGYPPRRLYGFHSATDLELMIQQRGRRDVTDTRVNDAITDRPYQRMAIKAVCEHLNRKHRKALLVMATGTGKTRVAISLVDVLMRNRWVKNVLFLADRTSLVNQAHRNFAKLLSATTTCVLSDGNNAGRDMNARIVFSTYQTMINYIDTDSKPFSVGRFDLIIIDEAHRSIFGKYGAMFNYFDALLVGLTATPREDVDKSTYDIFDLETGEPNFAYELDEAVADGYLVNYEGFKCGTKILREGIKYSDLSPQEREQLEKVWTYERTCKALDGKTEYHRDIDSREMFNYIFNNDTVDRVLCYLMEHGLKVQSGERIGKTIIFAYNHRHAAMIVERFNCLYPEYGAGFCALIDNYVNYAQDLVNKFEVRDGEPQIAVSVDMLDTGIDVPDVLNLVFFKAVKSKIKFMQMIGRGTRLSKNIFGAGQDKKCFYIFDWCGNFDYFEKNPNGKEIVQTPSLTERIFGLRVDIASHLQHQTYQDNDYCRTLHNNLKELLCGQVSALNNSHISVRRVLDKVAHFKKAASWQYISEVDALSLKSDIAPLLPKSTLDENAKKFDVLALTIELSLLDKEVGADGCINKVRTIAEQLQEKATLLQVQAKMNTIKEVLSPVAWENVSLRWLEKVRTDLRELVKFLVGNDNKWFVIDIDDEPVTTGKSKEWNAKVSYKKRVIDYLNQHRDLPVLEKIYNIEPLNDADFDELERILWQELGSKEEYDKYTEGRCGNNVAMLVRSLLGVNRTEAMCKFGVFISEHTLNAEQEEFLQTIIAYVCENGDITGDIVVNEPPFDSYLNVFLPYIGPLRLYIDDIHNAIIRPQNYASAG
ncbi:MAG: DEAD/DEAH box helicase family protein [Alistipes sp.]